MTDNCGQQADNFPDKGRKADGHGQGSIEPSVCPPLSQRHCNWGVELSPAQSLLDEVDELRTDLEDAIVEARNRRERSPLRKELWWLDQLSRLLQRWVAEQSFRGRGNG